MIDPAALRTIADALDEANQAAAEQLRGMLNGRTNDSPAETGDGVSPATEPRESGGTSPSASEQVEVPSGEPTAAGRPTVASTTDDPRRPMGAAGSNPFTNGTRPCPECGVQLKRQGFGPHLSKKHGIRGEALAQLQRKSADETAPLRAHSYLCPTCDRPFTNQTDLATHRLSHPAPPKVQPVGDRPPVGFARGVSE